MDFLDKVEKSRPEANLIGLDLDCLTCYKYVSEAYYDRQNSTLYFWCDEDHESKIEEIEIDV